MTTRLLWLLPALAALLLLGACSSADESVRGQGSGPRSTPFPSVPPDPRVQAYRQSLAPLVDGYAAAFASLAAQAPSGTVSEANLKDSAWRSVYSSTVQTLESLGTRARALTPPPCLIEAHTDLVRATQAVDGATPHIALSTNAPSAVTAATQTMLGERAAIERAAARLKTAAC